MKKNHFLLMVFGCLALLITGCVRTLNGQLKAGVPFANDTKISRYERPVDQIYDAGITVLKFNGTLTSENSIAKTLEAKVNTRTVWVKVTSISPTVSQVEVQARTSGGGADMDLASEIDKQIALQLK
ncbi:MAG: DUF3568 family protein [Candidatus Omnitrophica bacterium]|nr:DUF3568 family protein [Candidatus Omnitrophota bacterium]